MPPFPPSRFTGISSANNHAINPSYGPSVRATVSNEDLARLRLAFFRESLDATLRGHPPSTPVFDLLGEVAEHANLNPLYELIDARGDELCYPMINSTQDLERHARRTHGSLIAIHAINTGGDEQLGKDVGAVVGLAVLLRGVPAAAVNRLSYMPKSVLKDAGIEPGEVLRGGQRGKTVFKTVGQFAEKRLSEVKQRVSLSEKGVRHVYWPLLMAGEYLRRLRRSEYDPFNERLQSGLKGTYGIWLQMRLLWARISGV